MANSVARRLTPTTIDSQQAAINLGYMPYQQHSAPSDQYANRVEVERREHDATLTFYRDGTKTGTLVAAVIVPLALLDNILVS